MDRYESVRTGTARTGPKILVRIGTYQKLVRTVPVRVPVRTGTSDGKESKSTDVSEYLNGDRLFPAICLLEKNQQITTIPIEQIEIRTPEIERLLCEENISVVEVLTKKKTKYDKDFVSIGQEGS